MEIEDLEAKARIVTRFMEKGARVVKIFGTNIEVDQREYIEAISGNRSPVSQSVNVNVSATAQASVDFSSQIQQIVKQLEQRHLEPQKLETAKKQLASFEEELRRPEPRWPKVRKIFKWALSLGEELFLRLVVMWAQRHGLTGFDDS